MFRFVILSFLFVIAAHAQDLDHHRQKLRNVADKLQKSYVFIGQGSGVCISADGLMLTNHHVIANGLQPHIPTHKWRIRFADGRSYWAHILGTDPFGDLCLLQIDKEDRQDTFDYVPIGTAGDLSYGMTVYAIGDPFGLGTIDNTPTVSSGTLGSLRVVRGIYTDCIQTDAAVNPGNSGGPLLSIDGTLLGINGQIRTRTGMRINSGIGLAIACTQVQLFLPLLKSANGGYVHHSAKPKDLILEQQDSGVFVKNVPANSELTIGDRIITIDQRPITSVDTAIGCFAAIPYTGPETTMEVEVERDHTVMHVSVALERTSLAGKADHGMTVRKVGDVMRITGVKAKSGAEQANILVGETLLSLNGRPIQRRLDILKALIGKEIGDTVTARIQSKTGEERESSIYLWPK